MYLSPQSLSNACIQTRMKKTQMESSKGVEDITQALIEGKGKMG
jgi:hypothetical protein